MGRATVPRPFPAISLVAVALAFSGGCSGPVRTDGGDDDQVQAVSSEVRAARRQYDGAPPIIPHEELGASCGSCHDQDGLGVEGIGFAPASPHGGTSQDAATGRCRQCHVPQLTDRLFVASGFIGFEQDLEPGSRLYGGAPPTIPHPTRLRENCTACHVGPGVRPEVRTTHPERVRCQQCHVPITTREGILAYPGFADATDEGT